MKPKKQQKTSRTEKNYSLVDTPFEEPLKMLSMSVKNEIVAIQSLMGNPPENATPFTIIGFISTKFKTMPLTMSDAKKILKLLEIKPKTLCSCGSFRLAEAEYFAIDMFWAITDEGENKPAYLVQALMTVT